MITPERIKSLRAEISDLDKRLLPCINDDAWGPHLKTIATETFKVIEECFVTIESLRKEQE